MLKFSSYSTTSVRGGKSNQHQEESFCPSAHHKESSAPFLSIATRQPPIIRPILLAVKA